MNNKLNKYRNWRDIVIKDLKNDPKEMQEYIEIASEEYEKDGDIEAFLIALRTITEVQGGISILAKKTNLNRQSLYKALSFKGNPTLYTIGMILKALGYTLCIKKSLATP